MARQERRARRGAHNTRSTCYTTLTKSQNGAHFTQEGWITTLTLPLTLTRTQTLVYSNPHQVRTLLKAGITPVAGDMKVDKYITEYTAKLKGS